MKRTAIAALMASTAALGAQAGGIERVAPSTRILFEDGRYLELGWNFISPDVSGTVIADVPQVGLFPGANSGDMLGGYSLPSFAYRQDLGGGFSGMLAYNRPYGANTYYGNADPNYFANLDPFDPTSTAVASAKLSTNALTAIIRYTTENNFSVYGGLRYQTMFANASVPFVAGYTVNGDETTGWGYLVGAAYEKPEIALRVALTYYSKISHDFNNLQEYSTVTGPVITQTTVDTPQAVNLEFQSGVAENTLVFGSILWTNWKDFEIAPTLYGQLTDGGVLDDYAYNSMTYTLGVGRQFNENWSGSLSATYEPSDGSYRKNLGPTDGYTRLGAGVTYAVNKVEISGGVSYIWIGDTQTAVGPIAPATEFSGNTAWASGIRVGYRF